MVVKRETVICSECGSNRSIVTKMTNASEKVKTHLEKARAKKQALKDAKKVETKPPVEPEPEPTPVTVVTPVPETTTRPKFFLF
jgi:hypothetical protein